MGYSKDNLKRLLDEIQNEIQMEVTSGNGAEVIAALGEKYRQHRKTSFPVTNPEFVYRVLVLKLRGKNKKTRDIPMYARNFEVLVHALGYSGTSEFLNGKHPSINNDLKGCEGYWYSYVRCNSGQPFVLRAPVEIAVRFRDVVMTLLGARRTFTGKMKLEGDCIYCLLESGETKNLHLVLKTGLESRPNVLQGVFSGVSTGNDPIAGREVLVRQQAVSAFKDLSHDRVAIEKLLQYGNEESKIIAQYFSSAEENILKAGRSSNFEITDLIKQEPKTKNRKNENS